MFYEIILTFTVTLLLIRLGCRINLWLGLITPWIAGLIPYINMLLKLKIKYNKRKLRKLIASAVFLQKH